MGLKDRRSVFEATRAAAWLALLVASPAAAQTTLRSMHLEADIRAGDGGADVRIEYVLAGDGSSPLRFELLGFGSATADAFRLAGRETGTRIQLDPVSGSLRAAKVAPGAAGEAGERRIAVRYRIAEAVQRRGAQVRVYVPVLTVAVPAEGGAPLFTAGVRLPHGWVVSESFPNGLRARGDGRHAVVLAVAPSVVGLRARSDGAWRPGAPLVPTPIAAGVLATFGLAMSIPIFWGLFVACGAMIAAYVVWMLRVERR